MQHDYFIEEILHISHNQGLVYLFVQEHLIFTFKYLISCFWIPYVGLIN